MQYGTLAISVLNSSCSSGSFTPVFRCICIFPECLIKSPW
jgi:hypothetical protein